jgi:hypothetical protein
MNDSLIKQWEEFLAEYTYDDELSDLINETIEALKDPEERYVEKYVELEERFNALNKAYTELLVETDC